MYDLLTNVLAFAFALGVIIFVHEFGHLIVAKAFDVRVTAFSLGFGPRLGGFRRGETDYRVSAVPLGGYVKLGGEQPDEATGDPREFLSKPRWQRVLVYLAGPAMNVILAVVLIAIVFMVGTVIPNLPDMPAVVGGVDPGSSAAAAGLQEGDRIVAIDGKTVDNWPDVTFALITSPGRPVAADGGARRPHLPGHGDPGEGREVRQRRPRRHLPAGAAVDHRGREGRRRGTGRPPGRRQPAGGRRPAGDRHPGVRRSTSRSGRGCQSLSSCSAPARPSSVTVVPADVGGRGKIGVGIGFYQRYGPLQAFVQSVRYNVQIVRQTFIVVGKIFTRELSAKSALAGPIEIAAQSGEAARTGFRYLIYLMGFISISIAIVNLLPIPILDGGQIFILLVEGTMRRDLSLRIKEMVAQVGFVIIVLLMLTVIYFDLSKHWPPGFLSVVGLVRVRVPIQIQISAGQTVVAGSRRGGAEPVSARFPPAPQGGRRREPSRRPSTPPRLPSAPRTLPRI